MKKLLFLLIPGLLINPCLFSQTTEYQINELMSAYADNGQFNGVVLVKKRDKIVYEKAFGLANREWNVPNTLNSRFLIGSIGKSITAFMTMILVNDGLIDLNAPINQYIPEYYGPGHHQATIHQMLTHTSGIPNHGAIPNLSKKLVRWTYDTPQYLELIKGLKPDFEPGKGFSYSGIAYNLLAIICERVTNRGFGDLDERRAFGYEYHLLEGYMLPSYIEMCHVKGSGGVLSTARDLAKFDDECFHTQKLLPKELYQKIFTRYVKDWQYYGYGWWSTDQVVGPDTLTLISHGGSTDGYKAYNTYVLEDSIAKMMGYTIGHQGVGEAVKQFKQLKNQDRYFVNESELNQLARELSRNYGLNSESAEKYQLGLQEYPGSLLLTYSFAELLAETNYDQALLYSRKCVDLFGQNPVNAKYEREYQNALSKIREIKR